MDYTDLEELVKLKARIENLENAFTNQQVRIKDLELLISNMAFTFSMNSYKNEGEDTTQFFGEMFDTIKGWKKRHQEIINHSLCSTK